MGFVPFSFIDLIDIILVAVVMYWIYRTTKGTNAPYILTGIIVVYLVWVVVRTSTWSFYRPFSDRSSAWASSPSSSCSSPRYGGSCR